MTDFNITEVSNFRTKIRKAASYTLLVSDEYVEMNGTYTATLPVIKTTFDGTLMKDKMYVIENVGTTTVTVSPGTGNTINGTTVYYLYANGDKIMVKINTNRTDWDIVYPRPLITNTSIKDATITGKKSNAGLFYSAVAVTTNGTTAVNVFSSAGAPCAMTITGVIAVAKDTIAGNISITNGTLTVCSFAKSATAGIVTGEDGTIDNAAVTALDTLTVVNSGTGNCHVWIAFTSP